jgi:uncharacterized membrane protein YjjP (DUF1212 family)
MRRMVSRLEAVLSIAMAALLVCVLFSWDTATRVVGAVFLLLLAAMITRIILRKARGASWDQAWGRAPREAD